MTWDILEKIACSPEAISKFIEIAPEHAVELRKRIIACLLKYGAYLQDIVQDNYDSLSALIKVLPECKKDLLQQILANNEQSRTFTKVALLLAPMDFTKSDLESESELCKKLVDHLLKDRDYFKQVVSSDAKLAMILKMAPKYKNALLNIFVDNLLGDSDYCKQFYYLDIFAHLPQERDRYLVTLACLDNSNFIMRLTSAIQMNNVDDLKLIDNRLKNILYNNMGTRHYKLTLKVVAELTGKIKACVEENIDKIPAEQSSLKAVLHNILDTIAKMREVPSLKKIGLTFFAKNKTMSTQELPVELREAIADIGKLLNANPDDSSNDNNNKNTSSSSLTT